jgi:hypothetical protein
MRNQLVRRFEFGKVTHSGRTCAALTRPLGDQAHARSAQSENSERIAEADARPDFATSDGIQHSAILSAV